MDTGAGQVEGSNNAAARRSRRLRPTPVGPTPRREGVEQSRPVYRIKQHRPPSASLPDGGAELSGEALREHIRWWEDAIYWLHYLLRTVNTSLNKSSDDLRTCSEIRQVGRVQRPSGPRKENEEWEQWKVQVLNRKSCNLETVFYGPPILPDTRLPCGEEMETVRSFEESHRAYMMKHMGHLGHTRELLERLILQAEEKIKGLIHNLKKWELCPEFSKPKFPQKTSIFPLQTAPARTTRSGVHCMHSDNKQEDWEAIQAMATEFATLPEINYESFEDMGLQPELLRGLYACGFQKPSVIQQGGIVPICLGKNVILQGQSGVGKKACFLCGILQRVAYSLMECQALIVVQAPELAQHIENAVKRIGSYLGVKVHSCVGGKMASVQQDQNILASGVHVVVGTPGPILDLLQKSLLSPNHLKLFVLGEARVLNSHTDEIRSIVRYLPPTVQIGLFSDTLSRNDLQITREIMNSKPVLVSLKTEYSLVGIKQYYVDVEKDEWKFGALLQIYEDFGLKKVKSIIYVNSPGTVDFLMSQLRQWGHHQLLITTKVSRVDLRQVAYVINYDIPAEPAEYLHRTGHTRQLGRKRHVAINLITMKEQNILKDIERIHRVVIKELPEPDSI